jgi:hypothetical protein
MIDFLPCRGGSVNDAARHMTFLVLRFCQKYFSRMSTGHLLCKPLHRYARPKVTSRNNGGNDVHVMFMGRSTNLHMVWDTDNLPARMGDGRAYASASPTPSHRPRPRSGAAARRPIGRTTATASRASVARNVIYGVWPHSTGVLPASYEQKAIYVVKVQLEKAGVRLAAVLNQELP